MCLLAWSGCDSDVDVDCDKAFYAREGTVEFSALPESGRLAARLEGVVFEQVEFDWEDETATPVAGGESWCIDGFELDLSTEPRPTRCDPEMTEGCADIGEVVSDVSLTHCADEGITPLDAIGDDPSVLVLFLTAGWCSACAREMPEMARFAEARADEGVEVVYVLGEDTDFEAPTTAYCERYVARYPAARRDRFFRDHDGDVSFAAVFGRMWRHPDERGSFGTPWIAVIDAYDMSFIWTNSAPDGRTLDEVVDDALDGF